MLSIGISCARNKMLPILQFLDSPISKENIAKVDEDSLQQQPNIRWSPHLVFQNLKDMCIDQQQSIHHISLYPHIHEGIIKLIYKGGKKGNDKSWTPLTTLTFSYKIFAKALANQIAQFTRHIGMRRMQGLNNDGKARLRFQKQ